MNIPRLHIVTNEAVLRRTSFVTVAHALMMEGREQVALHVRGAGIPGATLLHLTRSCADVAGRTGAHIVVNDRLDLALLVGAWGVQLGRASFSVGDARSILPQGVRLGASVHDPEELDRAVEDGADFLLAGTLYQSASHPERSGSGTAWLSSSARKRPPVIGIGGITTARVPDVIRAGAQGVAVITGVWDADSPVAALAEYLKQLG